MSEKKRTYGSGSVIVHRGAWYGRWWIGGRYVKRKLDEIRAPGTREGLTRKQAEMALRRLMTEVRVVVPEERMTIDLEDPKAAGRWAAVGDLVQRLPGAAGRALVERSLCVRSTTKRPASYNGHRS